MTNLPVERRKWQEHFGYGLLIVFGAVLLTYATRDTTFMRRMEAANLDSWLAFQVPAPSSPIIVVAVTDQDYSAEFGAASPLAPSRVSDLICAIVGTGPSVIGVDLDTSNWSAAERDRRHRRCPTAVVNGQQQRIPTVWAAGGYEKDPGSVEMERINSASPGDCFAAPAVIPDDDGVLRAYLAEIVSGTERWPSFPRVIESIAQGQTGECAAPSTGIQHASRIHINFRGGENAFPQLTASTVLGAAGTPAWQAYNPLRGKIVLLGGTYRAARDRYVTPVGWMDGVVILAHAVQTELPGGAIKGVSPAVFLAIDISLGLVLLTITFFAKSRWVLPLVLLAVPVLSFTASLAVYNSFAYFVSFMPVLAGVFVHESMMHLLEHHRMKRELQMLKSRVKSGA